MNKLFPVALLLLFVALAAFVRAEVTIDDEADREAVREAVLDYVEGIYQVEPERIKRSVHPELAKVGYWRKKGTTEYRESWMTFDQLVELAGTWNAKGGVDAETAPKEIEIFDLMDQTATVKLSADWGVDHMQLAKIEALRMFMKVIWQGYRPDAQ